MKKTSILARTMNEQETHQGLNPEILFDTTSRGKKLVREEFFPILKERDSWALEIVSFKI